MYVETMLKAMRYHLYSAGLTFGPDFDKSEIHINRSYRIQNGIACRYIRLQGEVIRLRDEVAELMRQVDLLDEIGTYATTNRFRHDGCSICGKPFSVAEWDDRHTAPDGSDVHAECCEECDDA